MVYKNLLSIFFKIFIQNIFEKKIVNDIYEFYNFVRINYL